MVLGPSRPGIAREEPSGHGCGPSAGRRRGAARRRL